MRDLIIAVAAIAVVIVIVAVLARAYLREDTGRHGENINAINQQPLVTDDTEQMSFYDRAEYIAAQERLANSGEQALFGYTEDEWSEEMRGMFAEHAQLQAVLNSQVIAFPDWTDTEFPHSESNVTCPGEGIKCLCWDIAALSFDWERIAA